MTFQYSKVQISSAGQIYSVCIPVYPFQNLYVCSNQSGICLFADIPDLNQLGQLFEAASSSKNEIWYLPIRRHGLTEHLREHQGEHSEKDLLILSHTLQFPAKAWKEIRQKISRNQSVSKNMIFHAEGKTCSNSERREFLYRENKDYLDLKLYADTAILTGSRKVFLAVEDDCFRLANSEPDKWYREMPGSHDHRHLEFYLRSNEDSNCRLLYYDQKLWGC